MSSARIPYAIHSSSNPSTTNYAASNLLVDTPAEGRVDSAARWTGCAPAAAPPARADSPSGSVRTASGSRSRQKLVQFVTLELERPSLVHAIGFGKYHKPHPCNLSELQVYGGLSPDPRHMQLLLNAGLKNDSTKELFPLPRTVMDEQVLLPVKYLRIEAIAAHSLNYNVSIWHVWLEGVSTPAVVDPVLHDYDIYRQRKTSHLVMSYLRRSPSLVSNFRLLFDSLSPETQASFEHPLLGQLHTAFVARSAGRGAAAMVEAEAFLDQCQAQGLLDDWGKNGSRGTSRGRWEPVLLPSSSEKGKELAPRGGHSVVLVGRRLLLFGGWSGQENLGDLWELNLDQPSAGWSCLLPHPLVEDTSRPGPRSCAQWVLDESTGDVYLLGGLKPSPIFPSRTSSPPGLVDRPPPNPRPPFDPYSPRPESRPLSVEFDGDRVSQAQVEDELQVDMKNGSSPSSGATVAAPAPESDLAQRSDFWRYKTVGERAGTWELLQADTEAENGPALIYDHQMVISAATRRLYVYGGKRRTAPTAGPAAGEASSNGGNGQQYSDLFMFDLDEGFWMPCDTSLTEASPSAVTPASRVGHSMVLERNYVEGKYLQEELWVLGGKREDSYVSDVYVASLALSDGKPMYAPSHISGAGEGMAGQDQYAPPPAFTLRAVADRIAHPDLRRWTLISGVTAPFEGKTTAYNGEMLKDVWRFRGNKWSIVQGAQMDSLGAASGDRPVGRFAAQVVHDPVDGWYYLVGGNAGDPANKDSRLGDVWRLKVVDPTSEEATRRAKFALRKYHFAHLCRTAPTLDAVAYLSGSLAPLVDHSDPVWVEEFNDCFRNLLTAPAELNLGEDEAMVLDPAGVDLEAEYRLRMLVWRTVCDLFNARDTEPREDLLDLC